MNPIRLACLGGLVGIARSLLSKINEKQRKNAEWDNGFSAAVRVMETDYAKLVDQLRTPDTDLDFMQLFRFWVQDHERLDLLLRAAEERFKVALAELDCYQRGRLESLKEELDIIEGEVISPRDEMVARDGWSGERRRIPDGKYRRRSAVRPSPTLGSRQNSKKAEGGGSGR